MLFVSWYEVIQCFVTRIIKLCLLVLLFGSVGDSDKQRYIKPASQQLHSPSLYLHIGKIMEMNITIKMLNNAKKKPKKKLKLLWRNGMCFLSLFDCQKSWVEVFINTAPSSSPLTDRLCPAGQLYQNCSEGDDGLLSGRGVACEHTCESHLLNLTCSTHEPCVAGCTCPPGWVMSSNKSRWKVVSGCLGLPIVLWKNLI